jgi:hypothetical protein
VRQHITRFLSAGWIDRHVSFVDVTNDAVFVDDKSGSIAKALFFVEDPVILDYCAFEIAEYGKSDAELFGKLAVGGNAVNTETENLSIVCIEFGDISLIRL